MTASLTLALVALAPRTAHAQGISETQGTAILDYTQNGQPSSHPNNLAGTWITFNDCENDVLVYVPVTVATPPGGFANYNVAAYATTVVGTDCGVSTNRSGANAVCWQVPLSPGTLTAIPVQQVTYELSVRDLLSGVGKAPGADLGYAPATEAVCHTEVGQCPLLLSVQFIVSDLGGNDASSLQLAFSADLSGAPGQPDGSVCATPTEEYPVSDGGVGGSDGGEGNGGGGGDDGGGHAQGCSIGSKGAPQDLVGIGLFAAGLCWSRRRARGVRRETQRRRRASR